MNQIVVENLGKHFGNRVIFRRLSFSLGGGHSLAVTGANGSGKSTLLRILAGVLTPSAGSVTIQCNGKPITGEKRPLSTGMVAPYLNVYDGLSARENLQFIARSRRSKAFALRVGEILDIVGLTHRADERVVTFSSGMKQRVKFAAALLTNPPLLLLDEPSSNLDPRGLAMIERVLGEQAESGGLLVLATNDAAEAERCGSVLRIEDYHA